jgi:hypothetical protein
MHAYYQRLFPNKNHLYSKSLGVAGRRACEGSVLVETSVTPRNVPTINQSTTRVTHNFSPRTLKENPTKQEQIYDQQQQQE